MLTFDPHAVSSPMKSVQKPRTCSSSPRKIFRIALVVYSTEEAIHADTKQSALRNCRQTPALNELLQDAVDDKGEKHSKLGLPWKQRTAV